MNTANQDEARAEYESQGLNTGCDVINLPKTMVEKKNSQPRQTSGPSGKIELIFALLLTIEKFACCAGHIWRTDLRDRRKKCKMARKALIQQKL